MIYYNHWMNSKESMEEHDISAPKNQQTRQDEIRENDSPGQTRKKKSSNIELERIMSESLSERDVPFQAEMIQPSGEMDMISHRLPSPLMHINESGNTLNTCYNCGQGMKINSTPRLSFNHSSMDTFSQKGFNSHMDTFTQAEPVNFGRPRSCDASGINTAVDVSSKEYLQNSGKEKSSGAVPDKVKVKKEKKTISSKTFAHGLMDMSLMTSNASQLRAIMSNPNHEFYTLLIWLLIISVILQISSGIVLIVSDFYKSQIKEKDRQNQRKRKILNFIALAMMMVITSLNVLITAFNTPSSIVHRTVTLSASQQPVFSSSNYQLHSNHTEL